MRTERFLQRSPEQLVTQVAWGKVDEQRGSGKGWGLAEAALPLSSCQGSCVSQGVGEKEVLTDKGLL